MKLFVPIHITHKEDMDGIGCAVLSRFAFNSYQHELYNSEYLFSKPYIIGVGSGKEAFENKIQSLLNLQLDGALSGDPDSLFKISDRLKAEIDLNIERALSEKDINGITADDISESEDIDLIFIRILTDCYNEIIDIFDKAIEATYPNSYVFHWDFDHHATNPHYGDSLILESEMFPFPKIVRWVVNYEKPFKENNITSGNPIMSQLNDISVAVGSITAGDILSYKAENICMFNKFFSDIFGEENVSKHNFDVTSNVAEREKSILIENGLTYDLILEEAEERSLLCDITAERSATFLYFKFLYEYGFIGIKNIFENYNGYYILSATSNLDKFSLICRMVAHISNYDTYEFDKVIPGIPERVRKLSPDCLTVLWKYQRGDFYGMIKKMEKAIYNNALIRERRDATFVFPISDEETVESNVPILQEDIDVLKFLYKQRILSYSKEVRYAKVITFKDFKSISTGKLGMTNEMNDDDLIVVFLEDVSDASFTGNKVLKEFPEIKMACMSYVGSRTLSLRSNNKDDFAPNCSFIAGDLGGGGHKYAAGCKIAEEEYFRFLHLVWNRETPYLSDVTPKV